MDIIFHADNANTCTLKTRTEDKCDSLIFLLSTFHSWEVTNLALILNGVYVSQLNGCMSFSVNAPSQTLFNVYLPYSDFSPHICEVVFVLSPAIFIVGKMRVSKNCSVKSLPAIPPCKHNVVNMKMWIHSFYKCVRIFRGLWIDCNCVDIWFRISP